MFRLQSWLLVLFYSKDFKYKLIQRMDIVFAIKESSVETRRTIALSFSSGPSRLEGAKIMLAILSTTINTVCTNHLRFEDTNDGTRRSNRRWASRWDQSYSSSQDAMMIIIHASRNQEQSISTRRNVQHSSKQSCLFQRKLERFEMTGDKTRTQQSTGQEQIPSKSIFKRANQSERNMLEKHNLRFNFKRLAFQARNNSYQMKFHSQLDHRFHQ